MFWRAKRADFLQFWVLSLWFKLKGHDIGYFSDYFVLLVLTPVMRVVVFLSVWIHGFGCKNGPSAQKFYRVSIGFWVQEWTACGARAPQAKRVQCIVGFTITLWEV